MVNAEDTSAGPDGATMIEGLRKELAVINDSLKGRMSIADASVLTDIASNNTRLDLFLCVKELYNLSSKILNTVNLTPQDGMAAASAKTDDELTAAVKGVLVKCLPEILASQLKGILPVHECSKTESEEVVPKVDTSLPTVHTMIVEKPKKDEEDGEQALFTKDEWKTSGKKKFAETLKDIPVKHATVLADGRLKFTMSSKENLESAVEVLKQGEDKLVVTPDSKERKKLDPKIMITKLDDDIVTKEDLDRELYQKNQNIKDLRDAGLVIKTVFVEKEKRFAVVQMSPEIRESIRRENDKVYIGLSRFPVRDRFHVVQCYHCQGYGHMAKDGDCRNFSKPAVCQFCAGPHRSDKCTKKTSTQCSNCMKSNNSRIKAKATTHRASDELCPSFVGAKESLMSRTATVSEATKNAYRQWAHNKQREYNRV